MILHIYCVDDHKVMKIMIKKKKTEKRCIVEIESLSYVQISGIKCVIKHH